MQIPDLGDDLEDIGEIGAEELGDIDEESIFSVPGDLGDDWKEITYLPASTIFSPEDIGTTGIATSLDRDKSITNIVAESLSSTTQDNSVLAYGLMRLGEPANYNQRGKLHLEALKERYLETLQRHEVVVKFDVIKTVKEALNSAQGCLSTPLPPGGIKVRKYAGSFDYAYPADGRVDILSDGKFHSVPLTNRSTEVNVRYIVVPREDTNVFRVAQLRNPLAAPLLPGPVDVYVDGEYILSTNIDTVPAHGEMELGLGVEQAIKVARNTTFTEARSGETLVAFNEFRHQININIANTLPRKANIEVRERVPIAAENAKVDVDIGQVSPPWQEYKQTERDAPIKGGYRWQIEVPGQQETQLTAQYTVKTFVDREIIGGNRREE